ncbi:ABC transporter substrate-binding protein [Cryptosporangium arvum]|uniref:ABC-type nitrate/sulfonate/bicarbonate transport system, periplasmic component n=1 Tax=Cryptosporangium arvum DSM 44712 TaxID=927661 RepID=A0A010ZKH2_9ACTN|nr:ABC transporter substrate-binding protein [Cryptosporangium arvum]EXG79149.1 ABC-type nitrate/sulfonate/bicarbonate transport system, periplasmic component [Cryptosporangium arvum DSM 44712]
MISRRQLLAGSASLGLLGALAACGDDDSEASGTDGVASTLRLGHFPNLTHATALVGIQNGLFAKALGSQTKLETKQFNAGPAAIEQIFAEGLDATYIGPNPTVNAFAKSKGEVIRVIAGSASGGVAFVVKKGITEANLKGTKIGTPQLGNTQDVALRYWLKEKGLTATKDGGGDVKIQPQENAQILEKFTAGQLDGAWVPEPWVSRLVSAGGEVLIDERDLWPGKRFVITNLIVRTEYLKKYPKTVKALLQAHVDANDSIKSDAAGAQKAVSEQIGKLTGKPLKLDLITKAWPTLEFLNDPIASSLITGAKHAEEIGLLDKVDLDGLYDLKLLNEVLASKGETAVKQS